MLPLLLLAGCRHTLLPCTATFGPSLPALACLPLPACPCLGAVWEMFYCRDPYEGLMDGQICVGVSGVWLWVPLCG